MPEGVNLSINNASVTMAGEIQGLHGNQDDKKLFNKDNHSELMKVLSDLPESFREVLKQTMYVTNQDLRDSFLNEFDTKEKLLKPNLEKPSAKEGDVKKLISAFGTPALYLGSKIDDIVNILKKPKDEIATSKSSPISASGIIILGSNVENSKQYIKDFQELTTFISKQKVPDIGAFEQTQRKLDNLTKSLQQTTTTKVDDKSSEKFTTKMGSITSNIGKVIKEVIVLNTVTSLVDFKKANQNVEDLKQYISSLGSLSGDDLSILSMGITESSKAALHLTMGIPIFSMGIAAVNKVKEFFWDIGNLVETTKLALKPLTKKAIDNLSAIGSLTESIKQSAINITIAGIFSNQATRSVVSVNNFLRNGLSSVIDELNILGDKTLKSYSLNLETLDNVNTIAVHLLGTSLIFSALAPFATFGWVGLRATQSFLREFTKLIYYVNDKMDQKTILSGTKIMGKLVALTSITLSAMMVSGTIIKIFPEAMLGIAGMTAFALGMSISLKLIGSLSIGLTKGLIASALVAVFAGTAFLSLKALSLITPEMTKNAMVAVLGFVGVMATATAIGAASSIALPALGLGVAASALTVVFAGAAYLSIKSFNKIDQQMIDHSIEIVSGKNGLSALFKSFTKLTLTAPLATAALAVATPAMLLMVPFSLAARSSIEALSSINASNIDNIPLMINNVGKVMSSVNGLAPQALLAIANISIITAAIIPSAFIAEKIASLFKPEIIDGIVGDNKEDPTKSSYGLASFVSGIEVVAKQLASNMGDFVLGSASALAMGVFFSNIEKPFNSINQLSQATKQGIDQDAIIEYMDAIDLISDRASKKSLISSLKDAAKSWISDKLGTSMEDTIDSMSNSADSMRSLSLRLQGINLDGISIFLEAINKINDMGTSSPNISKSIKSTISGIDTLSSSISLDGSKFSDNISSLMPGIEKLQEIPDGNGLIKKANDINSAINTIFSTKSSRDADNLISRVDKLASSLERLSKVDTSRISKVLGIERGTDFDRPSNSTIGIEQRNKNNQSNVNIDNSNLEGLLKQILASIEGLKKDGSWADDLERT